MSCAVRSLCPDAQRNVRRKAEAPADRAEAPAEAASHFGASSLKPKIRLGPARAGVPPAPKTSASPIGTAFVRIEAPPKTGNDASLRINALLLSTARTPSLRCPAALS